MGRFVNPNNGAFQNALNAEIYVDKTGLIEATNRFLDTPLYREDYPALVVELKWNKSAQTALQQIKEKRYAESLKDYAGDILLVGINYDKKTKEHSCSIEKLVK